MKTCFVYSNRSEYSILEPFILYFKKRTVSDALDLSKEIKNIAIDRNLYHIYHKVYLKLFRKRYDYLIILGDRRELPFVALAAFFSNVKIVHIGAGEFHHGLPTYDQIIRPIISLLSHFQICLSKKAKKEVISLFSAIPYLKHNAYFVGNPVFKEIDTRRLKRIVKEKYDLVLLHPQSLSQNNTKNDVEQLWKYLSDKKTIFISGNKDKNSNIIENFYKKLKKLNNDYVFIESLLKKKYFSLVKYCDNFYTNTSSVSEIKHLNRRCFRPIGERNINRNEHELNDNAPELLFKILKRGLKIPK